MTTSNISTVPIACNLNALNAEERTRRVALRVGSVPIRKRSLKPQRATPSVCLRSHLSSTRRLSLRCSNVVAVHS
jgi:hypothetical protein